VFRLLAPYFFTNSSKEVSKKVPPRHPSFYLKNKIKVPSSVPIFVAAAELTNHKKHDSLKQPLRKAPQKSRLHQLG